MPNSPVSRLAPFVERPLGGSLPVGDEGYDLGQAQWDKLELICRKLGLRPGMRLLDVGCGWGSLLVHAAKHHGVHAVGITLSAEQRVWRLYLVGGALAFEENRMGVDQILSPVAMTYTLAKGTGKPLLEKGLRKSRPGYAAYVERTSGFFPLPPRRG